MRQYKYIIIAILILGAIVFVLTKYKFLTIQKIDIDAKDITCVDNGQLKTISGLLGKNFFLVDFSKIETQIKNKFSCIKSVKLVRSFPNTVKLQVFQRIPFAKLITLKGNDLLNVATPSAQEISSSHVIDEEGVTIDNSVSNDNIAKIYVSDTGFSLPGMLKILTMVKIFKIDVKEAIAADNSLIITGIPKIIFKLDNNLDIQIASLQLILNEAKIDLNRLEFIDLRFDKPVVKIAPKKNG